MLPSAPRGNGPGLPASRATPRPDTLHPAAAPLPARPAPARAAPAAGRMSARVAAMPWAGRIAARADSPHAALSAPRGGAGAMAGFVIPRGGSAAPLVPPIMARPRAPVAGITRMGRGAHGMIALAMPPVRATPGAMPPLPDLRPGRTPAGMAIPATRVMTAAISQASSQPPMPRTAPARSVPARGVPPFPASLPPRKGMRGRPPFISPGPMERTGGPASSAPAGRRDDRPPVMQVTIPVTLDHQAVGQAMVRIDTAAARHELRATGTAPDVIRYPQMPGHAVGV
ncbi:hypothetical protein [Komagataeibacter swingsii]|uniref:Uncharacterized protein n=1 Tax=Komagataeibacter swingsii TaxID=215220 RepID=A0A850P3H4_9PROT|nr:hypothetical protein [Komagataeibacter swingsii]NVN38488.1 hypothetical protein [Komagataeibacter swingsii]